MSHTRRRSNGPEWLARNAVNYLAFTLETCAGFRAYCSTPLRDFARCAHFYGQGKDHYFPQSTTWIKAPMLHWDGTKTALKMGRRHRNAPRHVLDARRRNP